MLLFLILSKNELYPLSFRLIEFRATVRFWRSLTPADSFTHCINKILQLVGNRLHCHFTHSFLKIFNCKSDCLEVASLPTGKTTECSKKCDVRGTIRLLECNKGCVIRFLRCDNEHAIWNHVFPSYLTCFLHGCHVRIAYSETMYFIHKIYMIR